MDKGNTFKTAIYEYLPYIDEILEEWRVPVRKRALSASIIFVEDCVIKVSTGSKEEFINSEYFSIIVNYVIDWYIEKYGQLAENEPRETLSGIVRYHNQPVRLNIPPTTTRIEKEGETLWLTFPDHLQKEESYEGLFDLNIKVESLSENELGTLIKEVEEVVALSRRTFISLMTVSGMSKNSKNMASSIWAHIEKAISDIISQKQENISVACWELHLAVEKAFKVYIYQFPGEKCWGHNLNELCEQSNRLGLSLDKKLLAELPSPNGKDVIKMRYSEIKVDSRKAVEYYLNSLKIICFIAEKLKRDIRIYNASILIKKAGWAR
jgi:HEPN domain-containing protein